MSPFRDKFINVLLSNRSQLTLLSKSSFKFWNKSITSIIPFFPHLRRSCKKILPSNGEKSFFQTSRLNKFTKDQSEQLLYIHTVCVIVPSLVVNVSHISPPCWGECIVLLRDGCAKQTTQLKVYYYGCQPSSFATPLQGCCRFLCNSEGVAFHSFATKQTERERERETNVLDPASLTYPCNTSCKTCSIGREMISPVPLRTKRGEIVWRIQDLISPVNDALERQVESTTSLGRDGLTGRRNAFD